MRKERVVHAEANTTNAVTLPAVCNARPSAAPNIYQAGPPPSSAVPSSRNDGFPSFESYGQGCVPRLLCCIAKSVCHCHCQ